MPWLIILLLALGWFFNAFMWFLFICSHPAQKIVKLMWWQKISLFTPYCYFAMVVLTSLKASFVRQGKSTT